ncbi:MAG: hypothetical protein LBL24_04090 [Bacteroidales bacterium]|jgi:hypothetical protein|nr:hypothetical protein [Bacteroidales bacterium]
MQRKNSVKDDILVEPVRMAYWKSPVRDDMSVGKICTAARPKPRMGFQMMNLLWRLVDVFRIDSMDMNALTGNASTSPCVETRCIASLQRNGNATHRISTPVRDGISVVFYQYIAPNGATNYDVFYQYDVPEGPEGVYQ